MASRSGLRAVLALALGVTGLPAPSPAESPAYRPDRTSWGAPAIDGTWDFRTLTPFERPPELAGKARFTPEEARAYREQQLRLRDVDQRAGLPTQLDVEAAYNSFWWDWGSDLGDDLRTSLLIDPPDGRLPAITPAAKARLEEQNRYRTPPVRDMLSYSANPATFLPEGPESVGLSERCLVGFNAGPPFQPSAYNNNLRIVQTESYVVLMTEMIHDARIVPLDGRPRLPEGIERWSGDARGRFEGDTLVVESTGFTDRTPAFQLPASLAELDRGAVGSGRDLHLVERFTPVGPGRLRYEYTVEAPGIFVRPFTVRIPMRRAGERIFEYACHEGNYAMRGMLKGARLLEAEGGGAPTGSGE